VLLTLVPFGAVAAGSMPYGWTIGLIGLCGLAQILVHLRYFLHIDPRTTSRDRLLAIGFAGVIVFLMVGGTVWIMLNLHSRMVF
jgi:cytochrome o ubiquinol oxidase operon protein cyoD